MAQSIGLPKGTRDFLPTESRRRNYIFTTLRSLFEKFGYGPLETPAVELRDTLLGKYGEEGDKLMFHVLKRGDKLNSVLENTSTRASELSDMSLRYDLTVPFARAVVQHRNEIDFPFKRYQIQPVWRADRPQKGRYREFYQCDIDVIGSDSLWNEVELVQIIDKGFRKLGINKFEVKLNNRKVLVGISQIIGAEDKFVDITVAIDKLDKIGEEGVRKELVDKGLDLNSIDKLFTYFQPQKSNAETIKFLKNHSEGNNVMLKGVEELEFVVNSTFNLGVESLQLDFSLARGLNYYTGCIFEVVSSDFPSSLCGGGRYDDLTSLFGLKDVSGVGISFGADRIYDLMLSSSMFKDLGDQVVNVLFLNFGHETSLKCQSLANELRNSGIKVMVYPDNAKLKKQFKYADSGDFSHTIICGSEELDKQICNVKNMSSGEQESVQFNKLTAYFLQTA